MSVVDDRARRVAREAHDRASEALLRVETLERAFRALWPIQNSPKTVVVEGSETQTHG